MFPGQCGNTAFFFKSQPDQFHFEFRGIVFPGKSFFSAHEVSTCKISGCLSYRILDSGPDGTQTTLTAKSAQWASKEWPQFSGVLALSPENPRRTAKLLSLQPVEEIWGVGNRIAKKLHVMGITTALQLSLTNPTFIRKNFNVVLERTVRELNGESCISLEEAPPPKQQIVCSRSFGQRITT